MIHANLKHFDCSGIYIIRNLVNNKVYVGSAQNIRKRIVIHKYYLNKGTHHSKKLQYSYSKHNKFLISILEKCSIKDLLKREQYWIDFYQSYKQQYGFNILKIAGSSLGHRCSEETKSKIGNANRGRKLIFSDKQKLNLSLNNSKHWKTHKFTEEHKNNISKNIPKIKVNIIVDNIVIKTYYSILDCIKDLKISSKTIYKYLNSNLIFKRYNCKFMSINT